MRDRLVLVWIEGLPHRLHRLEALALEDAAELALDEPHPLHPRLPLELLGDRRQRSVVPVEDVEELRDEIGLRELRELGPFGVVALAIVREIRGHALEVVREPGDSFRVRLVFGTCGRFLFDGRILCLRLALRDRFAIRPSDAALRQQLLRAADLLVHQ